MGRIELKEELEHPTEIRYKGKIYRLRISMCDLPELIPWMVRDYVTKGNVQRTYTEIKE